MFERLQIAVVGLLGSVLLRIIFATLRVEWRSKTVVDELNHMILVFWHGRQLMMPFARTSFKTPMYVIISAHRDGRMISDAIRRFGLLTVAGSSTRGGTSALKQLTELACRGEITAFTPDGPRGPVQKMKPGAISVAQRSGLPIYPIAFGAKRAWRFKSWDSMLLPKPFSRCAYALADPIYIPKELTEKEFTHWMGHVEQKLNEVTELVDRF
jgi:lysophospholipid acyltransferase (LPLAT)-like uncharacterized protein